jgi:dipeptidyl aminopeptidase/acylaminoacyl peptidase
MWSSLVLIFVLLLATGSSATAASNGGTDVPLEVYGRLPSIGNVAMSPDGAHIALTMTTDEERFVHIVSLADMSVRRSLTLGKVKLRNIMWADSRRVLFQTSTTGLPDELTGADAEFFMLRVFDIVTGESENPIHATSFFPVLNVIVDRPMLRRINGETLIYVAGLYITDRTFPALFELNLSKGTSKLVEMGSQKSRGWLVDENGRVVASETYDENEHWWAISIRRDGKLVEAVSGAAEIEYPSVVGFAPSGDILWLETMENSDLVWKPLSLEDGKLGTAVPEIRSFDGLARNPHTDRIFGGNPIGTDSDFVFFDSRLQETWETVQASFPGERVDLASASEDFQKMVILVDGHVHGYGYYMFDAATLQFAPLGNVYSNLPKIAEVRSITYLAKDGMLIPAFLTLPTGQKPENLPLVVLPHGGPATRDTARFDWWAQALASRGYAVLKPNFRGSDLGWEFMSAGFGEWGRKMQTDLSDGVRHLVREGIVDPDRVAIVGASYGGYAALAGATLDPGVFRCAVSVAGISDLRKFYKWIQAKTGRRDSISGRYWDRFIGASGDDDPLLETLSPREYAADVTIPILLIHGRDDTVVPYEQSKLMAKALKKAKKTVALVKLKNEDHWLSRSETRLQMLQSTISFLTEHNPPD